MRKTSRLRYVKQCGYCGDVKTQHDKGIGKCNYEDCDCPKWIPVKSEAVACPLETAAA